MKKTKKFNWYSKKNSTSNPPAADGRGGGRVGVVDVPVGGDACVGPWGVPPPLPPPQLKGDNIYSCDKCAKLCNGLKYSRVSSGSLVSLANQEISFFFCPENLAKILFCLKKSVDEVVELSEGNCSLLFAVTLS